MSGSQCQSIPVRHEEHIWALVLAGGEGTRLRALTTNSSGISVPKQFCSLAGGSSLLDEALSRAAQVAAPARMCVIVDARHERWWRPLVGSLPDPNVVIQPRNRGTAIGILLPLLAILRRDPEATLIVVPSDHFVRDEQAIAGAMLEALAKARVGEGNLILLGIQPEEADTELGYIVPGAANGTGVRKVLAFVEKPDAATAVAVIRRGALWNSFIFAVQARSLLEMFAQLMPETLMDLADAEQRIASGLAPSAELAVLYERLPALDFSRDVLQRNSQRLHVVTVPACGWSDLGTPRRVADVLRRERAHASGMQRVAHPSNGFLDLAVQHARLPPA